MANIKSFPNNQDEYIGAEGVMRWHHGRTSGVFGAGNNASVQALSTPGMAVEVSDGTGWMANSGSNGVAWWIDNESVDGAKLHLPVDAADGVLNRIDRVIVENHKLCGLSGSENLERRKIRDGSSPGADEQQHNPADQPCADFRCSRYNCYHRFHDYG